MGLLGGTLGLTTFLGTRAHGTFLAPSPVGCCFCPLRASPSHRTIRPSPAWPSGEARRVGGGIGPRTHRALSCAGAKQQLALEAWRIPKARDTWQSQPSPTPQLRAGPYKRPSGTPVCTSCVPREGSTLGGCGCGGPPGRGVEAPALEKWSLPQGEAGDSPEEHTAHWFPGEEAERRAAVGSCSRPSSRGWPGRAERPGQARECEGGLHSEPLPQREASTQVQRPASLCCVSSACPPSSPPQPLGGAERLGRPRQPPLDARSRGSSSPLASPGPPRAPGLRNEGHLGEGQWQRLDPLQVPESPGLRRHPNTQHPHGHLPSGGTRGPHAPPLARSFCRAARAGTAPARPAQRNPGLAEMRAPRTRAHLAALAPAAAPPAASAPPLPSAAWSPPTLCAVATPAALSGQGPRATHAGAAAVGAPDRPAFRSD